MWRYGRLAALVGGLILVGVAPAAADTPTPQTLSVLGNGTVFVTPDVADVSVEVSRDAATSRLALSRVNRVTDGIVAAIESLGIPAKDVQTENVNVSRNSPSEPGQSVPPRHRWSADTSLSVHLTDITMTGQAIDTAISHGASNIDGPNYSFGDPSAGLRAATRAALVDARRRADDAAAAVGYKVTGVEAMDLDPGSSGSGSAGSFAPKKLSHRSRPLRTHRKPHPRPVPTNIRPGTQEVDAQVAVIYIIGPA